jgi:hypothetical protein
MMRLGALLLISTLACAPTSRGRGPAAVDPGLVSAASANSVRLLVYRECSPEHCWSAPYIQWLSEKRDSVETTTPVRELGYGAVIGGISVEWENGSPRFTFEVSPSHGGFEPYQATLTPGESGTYTLNP